MVTFTSSLNRVLGTLKPIRLLSVALVAFAFSAISPAIAQTASAEKIEQAASQSNDQAWQAFLPSARKVGEGQFRRWGFLVYDATLWSATDQYRPNQPFALSLTYARSISRDQIVDASIDQMAELGIKVDQHPEWRKKLQNVFVDVTDGDSLTGVYTPGQGAVFYAGDRLSGQVDESLANAFFAIWLDPDTTEPELRLSLLGQSQ